MNRLAASLLTVLALAGLCLGACSGGDTSPTTTPATTNSPGPSVVDTSTPASSPIATEAPTATPEPSPTAAIPPSPTPGGPGQVIEHGPRDSNAVALTFDMGGRVDPALDIMNFLIDNDVRATIFMTGAMADNTNTDAGRQVLQLICDHPENFEPGNHSYSHPDFRDLSPEQMGEELSTTETAMAATCPWSPRPLFRPPFGGVDDTVASVAAANGYPYTIMWEVDAIDWLAEADGGPTTADIVDKVLANAQPGSIVLMHLGGYNTLDALPAVVAGLRDRGFTLVSVGDLLGIAQ